MSSLSDPKPLGERHDNLSADLPSNIENHRFLAGSNTLQHNVVGDPDMLISSKHIQTPSDNFSRFDISHLGSNLPDSLDRTSVHSTLRYSNVPQGGPTSNFPLYQQSSVNSYPDLSGFHPSELTSQYPNLCTPNNPFAYLDYQYRANQTVLGDTHNIDDVRGKHIPYPDISNNPHFPAITHQSPYMRNLANDVVRFGNDFHSSFLNDNVFNNDDVLHRFNREIVSPVPTHQFTEQNNAMWTVTHHNGADNLRVIGMKHRSSEEGRDEEWKRRKNRHQCRLCFMSFSTGNALGGHMSYHSKQKKLEGQRRYF